MIPVGVYLFTVLTVTTGVLGHPPVLASMTRRAVAWACRKAPRGRRGAGARPVPSWARKGDGR